MAQDKFWFESDTQFVTEDKKLGDPSPNSLGDLGEAPTSSGNLELFAIDKMSKYHSENSRSWWLNIRRVDCCNGKYFLPVTSCGMSLTKKTAIDCPHLISIHVWSKVYKSRTALLLFWFNTMLMSDEHIHIFIHILWTSQCYFPFNPQFAVVIEN